MWIWIVDFGTATGTGRKGGSCQSWVCVSACVCACVLAPTVILQPESIKPLINISNTAKARVGLTDVGDFENAHFTGLGGGKVDWWPFLMPSYCCTLYLCISSANRREGGGGRWSTGGNCHLGTPVPSAGLLWEGTTAWYGAVVLSGKAGRKGRRGCDSERASQPAWAVRQ